eukprot:6765828-Prymnesium_polylepis.1
MDANERRLALARARTLHTATSNTTPPCKRAIRPPNLTSRGAPTSAEPRVAAAAAPHKRRAVAAGTA